MMVRKAASVHKGDMANSQVMACRKVPAFPVPPVFHFCAPDMGNSQLHQVTPGTRTRLLHEAQSNYLLGHTPEP